MRGLVQSNNTYYIGNIPEQIRILKAQFLQLYPTAPLLYGQDAYEKAIKSLCGRVAKHFGLKFNKNPENLQDEVNKLVRAINPEAYIVSEDEMSQTEIDGNDNEQSGQEEGEAEAVQPKSGAEA